MTLITTQQPIDQQPAMNNGTSIQLPPKRNLKSWKMRTLEFQSIIDFVANMTCADNTIFKRGITKLPYSLAVIPKNGVLFIYILLKRHKLEELGEGRFNRVTRALDTTNLCEVAFRSCKLEHLGDFEVKINLQLSKFPGFFVATDKFFYYEGSCSDRNMWEPGDKPVRRASISKQDKPIFQKVGALLEIGKCSLYTLLNTRLLTFDILLYLALSVAKSLKVMHENEIVHLDFKTDNILIALDGSVKITDFGASRYLDGKKIYSSPRNYMPVEIAQKTLSKEEFQSNFSFDMWSFGVVLLWIFFPTVACTLDDLFESLRKNEITYEMFERNVGNLVVNFDQQIKVTQELRKVLSLIKNCLSLDVEKRAKVSDAVVELEKILGDSKCQSQDDLKLRLKNLINGKM